MKNISKIILAAFSLVVISSCYKTATSIGTAGPSLVRFPNPSPTSVNTNSIVALSGTQAATVKINRDASDPAVLAQAETVTLSVDNTIITAYNTANGTAFFATDPTAYTFGAANPLTNGKITVSFAAGEFTKDIQFNINLATVPAGASAFGLKIESSTVSKTSAGSSNALVALIKNPFAGTYAVTGTRYNYTGVVAWNNVLPVPPGNVGTTDMSLYSPRSGTPDDGTTFEIPFGNVGTGYNYIITYNATAKTISVNYTFASVYSNFQTTVVSLTPPEGGVKAKFRIITHYNNALAASGNDRVFDETFVQQ
jgi:hypothetical protein